MTELYSLLAVFGQAAMVYGVYRFIKASNKEAEDRRMFQAALANLSDEEFDKWIDERNAKNK